MKALWLLAIVAGLASGACVTYERGTFAAVSTASLPVAIDIVEEFVEGRACGDLFREPVVVAIDDALTKAPGANALIGASTGFESFCVVVRGTAVRVPQARGQPGSPSEPGR
ncbi:MAG: hypothetical protein ACE5FL_08380 [Myxococcota bacterium]